jgi:hypothetical protein
MADRPAGDPDRFALPPNETTSVQTLRSPHLNGSQHTGQVGRKAGSSREIDP